MALTEKQKLKVVELYEIHKMTVRDIAERFGVRSPAVTRILNAAGVVVEANRKL